MAVLLRSEGNEESPTANELVDPRAGTALAVAFPLLAWGGMVTWVAAGLPETPDPFWTLGVLPLVCALYGLFPLLVDRRVYATFEAPTVILTGLVGGPLAGFLAGVAAGLGDYEAVWRRRLAFGGVAMLQGVVAGTLGVAVARDAVPLGAAAAVAGTASLAVGLSAFALVMLARRCWSRRRLADAVRIDVAEMVVSLPLVYVAARTFHSSPAAVSLAVVSALALVGAASWALTRDRRRLEKAELELRTDRLTGVLNRAGFDEAAAREHARVVRGELPAGLLVCDLDHFGRFNKRHGHDGGDEALRHAIARIRSTVRAEDLVARWGGEELCVLCPHTSLDELGVVAERIRRAVGWTPVELEDEQADVTISIGGSLVVPWLTIHEAFKRADEALYVAKRKRNATCILSPPPPATSDRTQPAIEPIVATSAVTARRSR